MKLTVYWTRYAEKKLDNVYTYYAERAGSRIANKLIVEIIKKSISLESSPTIGQIEPLLIERREKFRYLIHQNYKMIYWINEDLNRIEVVNLFDCRQNPDELVVQIDKLK